MIKNRVLVASLTSIIIISSIFISCSSKINKIITNSPEEIKTASEKVITPTSNTTLILQHNWTEEDVQTKAIEKMVNSFNDSQDKISVEIEKVTGILMDLNNLPDITIIDNPDMAAFAAKGLLADITDKMDDYEYKDDFYPGPIASCMLNGKYYGVPLGSNDLALYYNKDIFEASGLKPPTTFNELKRVAKKLSHGDTYGLAISADNTSPIIQTFQFIPWLISSGAKYNEIGSEEGISSLQFLTELIDIGAMSRDVLNWSHDDIKEQFITNKAAMIVNGPWIINRLIEDTPNLNWGVIKIPKEKKYSSVLGGENWGIVKGKNEDIAWEFIKFTQKEEVLNEFCAELGYIPSRMDIAESNKSITKDPNMSVFLDELQYASPRGPHENWPQISDAIANALKESLTKAKTPNQAAKDAQDKIDALLK